MAHVHSLSGLGLVSVLVSAAACGGSAPPPIPGEEAALTSPGPTDDPTKSATNGAGPATGGTTTAGTACTSGDHVLSDMASCFSIDQWNAIPWATMLTNDMMTCAACHTSDDHKLCTGIGASMFGLLDDGYTSATKQPCVTRYIAVRAGTGGAGAACEPTPSHGVQTSATLLSQPSSPHPHYAIPDGVAQGIDRYVADAISRYREHRCGQ